LTRSARRFLSLGILFTSLCTLAPAQVAPSQSGVPLASKLVDEYFNLYFHYHPSAATSAGFHRYDQQLEDYSRASRDREAQSLRAFEPKLARALAAPRKLPQSDALDLQFLQSSIQSRLLDIETIRTWQKDPDPYASGPAYSLFLLIKRDFAPQEDRLRSVIARERKIPAALMDARRNLKNPPRVFTEIALDQIPGTITFFKNDVPAAFSAVRDPKLLAEFRATTQQVVAALRSYENFLKKNVLPASHGDFRLGSAVFRKKLLYDEMVDIPLNRLLEIGYADLHRNQDWLKKTAAQIDPNKSTLEVLADVRKDHPEPGQLLQSFRNTLAGLRQFIEQRRIITIPSDLQPVVEETPPFARALTTAAMETPGAFETKAPGGIFQVTLPDPSWKTQRINSYMEGFDRPSLISTAIHEVYPGHYEQYLWTLKIHSKVRQLLYCGTTSEGWAHYTEQMMLDEGFSSDPKVRIGQLIDALLRDSRFIVGLEMHTGRMTLDQAKSFFVEQGYQVPPIAEVEARRGTSDPTYLVYTLGKLQIMKLREDYRKQQGDKFTLQDFHDRFLEHGGLPIKLIRESMLQTRGETL
jgi:uncharacterized protein (DUF885 family)